MERLPSGAMELLVALATSALKGYGGRSGAGLSAPSFSPLAGGSGWWERWFRVRVGVRCGVRR